jgi:hypothetical protein
VDVVTVGLLVDEVNHGSAGYRGNATCYASGPLAARCE